MAQHIPALLFGLLALFVSLLLFASHEEKRYRAFLKDNDCRLVRVVKGSYTTRVLSGGKVVVTTRNAGSRTYLCKDGIEYVR